MQKQVKIFAAFAVAVFLVGAITMTSCSVLTMIPGIGGYGNTGIGIDGSAFVKGQFRVQFVGCVGSLSSQNVTAVITVTNTGPNAKAYIGGSLDGTVAIDSYGATSKPYSSTGRYYDLPSNVVVRVEILSIGPVRPGTPAFQSLRINVGSGNNNIADFRNVPIVWD